jgi:hypothetical protein
MEPRDHILRALGAEDGALRRAGVELVIDHVLAQPLSTWLDVESVTLLLVTALRRPNVERTIEKHVLPGLGRVRSALRAGNERVGDAVSDEARAAIDRLVTHPNGPRFAWLRGALDRDKLRALLAPALQEVFMSFASRIPLAGREAGATGSAAAAAASLVGRLGRGTGERLLSLGKSVADNLGVDLEARLRDAARDYSQGAVVGLERAISARLQAPEAAKLMEGLARSVLDHVLATPMTTILDDLDRLPLSGAIAVAAPILEHDLARELWRAIIESEVRAVLALEGQRTLRELLDEAGLLEQVRARLLERGEPAMRTLFTSEPFALWVDRLLQG